MLRIIWTNWIWKIDEDWRVNWRRLTYKKQKHSWRLQNKSTKCQNFRKLLFLFFQIYHTGGCKWAVIFLFSFIMCSEMELVHFFTYWSFILLDISSCWKHYAKYAYFPIFPSLSTHKLLHRHVRDYSFLWFIRFTTTFTITSFSSVLLSAIIKVKATRVLSANRLEPSLR